MNDLPPLDVIHEDNHLLAAVKPAGVLVQGDRTGDASLLERTRAWLRVKYAKPGNVYVGLVHRLDRPASGVVLFAKTSKAAGRLCDQFRRRTVEKVYRVAVVGRPPAPSGTLAHHVVVGREGRRTAVHDRPVAKAKEARLRYETLGANAEAADLRVWLETGRKHQIRAQLAHVGCPVVGDLKYGAPTPLAEGRAIALHAERLTVEHPTRREPVALTAPPPPHWPAV